MKKTILILTGLLFCAEIVLSQGFYNKKWFILSGLLRSQARDVSFNLSQNRINIIKTWECDGIWHTFLGKKD